MPRINADDYFEELDLLSPDQVINKSIHTMGNHLNSVSAAADMLRYHLNNRDAPGAMEKVERMLEIIIDNTDDLTQVLNAMGKYNNKLR